MDANVLKWTISEAAAPYVYTMADGNNAEDKANIFMIIGMFATKTVSLEKAAELAGKSIWDFVEILKKYDFPWGEYTKESSKLDDISLAGILEKVYELQ